MRQPSTHSTASVSTERSETEILDFCLRYALENDVPLAFWRLPRSSLRYLIIARHCRQLDKNATIEELATGFMFAPFDPSKAALYLQADYLFTFENGKVRDTETQLEKDSVSWLEEEIKHTSPVERTRLKPPTSSLPASSL